MMNKKELANYNKKSKEFFEKEIEKLQKEIEGLKKSRDIKRMRL